MHKTSNNVFSKGFRIHLCSVDYDMVTRVFVPRKNIDITLINKQFFLKYIGYLYTTRLHMFVKGVTNNLSCRIGISDVILSSCLSIKVLSISTCVTIRRVTVSQSRATKVSSKTFRKYNIECSMLFSKAL